MAQQTYDVLVKCIVIGDSYTGKSCILHRFTENKFLEDCTGTIGVEFGAKVVDVMNKSVKLQIWDTAGQERYRGVTRSYYRGAMACLLVYDITVRESFNHVEKWLNDARLLAGPDIAVILIGNKCDLEHNQRQVQKAEASQLAAQNGMLFFETSARTGEYVDEAFLKIAKTVLMRQASDVPHNDDAEDTIDLVGGGDRSKDKKKGCSC